jgi:hypothetical protein
VGTAAQQMQGGPSAERARSDYRDVGLWVQVDNARAPDTNRQFYGKSTCYVSDANRLIYDLTDGVSNIRVLHFRLPCFRTERGSMGHPLLFVI